MFMINCLETSCRLEPARGARQAILGTKLQEPAYRSGNRFLPGISSPENPVLCRPYTISAGHSHLPSHHRVPQHSISGVQERAE